MDKKNSFSNNEPQDSNIDLITANLELIESRRMLATLMNNLPGIAYRCLNDTNWTMEFISSGCLELTGYNVDDLVQNKNLSYNDIIHPEDTDYVWNGVQEGINNRRFYKLTYRIKTKSGIEKWVWEQGAGVFSEKDELIALEGFITDITESKHMEAELQKYREHLENEVKKRTHELLAANKELESFSYSVSHDLRAPLRAIDGFSKALLDDYNDKLDAEGKDFLNRIRGASQKMAALIDDMLKLSRLTIEEMKYVSIDLSEMADRIINDLKLYEQNRTVEFINAPGLFVNGDPQLIHAAMENLLGNAWKFTSREKNAIIEFGVEVIGNEKIFFIRDNGAGFDTAYSDKLFGAFQRLHTVSEFPGTGIGLAIVQRVINRHGGRIWAESIVDKGTTFYFTI